MPFRWQQAYNPGVSTSCLLSGKGDWSTNTEYVECDVVSSDSGNYVCNTLHTSPAGVFGDDITNWDLLSLKGDKGEPGSDAEKTTSFTDLIDQAADTQIPTTIARDSEITWRNLDGIPAGFADETDNDSGGDITSVIAGNGLAGGGTIGNVTLTHSDTSSHPSANNSNGSVIQDITIDTYGHLTDMNNTNLDDRYYTKTQANSNYINVSGDSMTDNLSVNQNVNVTGLVYIGYEQVASPAEPLDEPKGNYTILETSHCYYTSAWATCPTGKVVLGGGCKTSDSAHALVSTSRPYQERLGLQRICRW